MCYRLSLRKRCEGSYCVTPPTLHTISHLHRGITIPVCRPSRARVSTGVPGPAPQAARSKIQNRVCFAGGRCKHLHLCSAGRSGWSRSYWRRVYRLQPPCPAGLHIADHCVGQRIHSSTQSASWLNRSQPERVEAESSCDCLE